MIKKLKIYLACILIFAIGLVAAGITLAYFYDKDEVSNTQTSDTVEIKLLEVKWEEEGKAKAAAAEPGMTILKDPCVYNCGEADVYIRMKLVIVDEDGEPVDGSPVFSDTESTDSTNTESADMSDIADAPAAKQTRYEAIINALYCSTADTDSTADTNVDSTAGTGSTGDSTADTNEINLLSTLDTGVKTSNNSAFVYNSEDGWFYYMSGKTFNVDNFTILPTGGVTPTLFDYYRIPVLKSEYNGYFDTAFTITVIAQAVPASITGTEIMNAFAALAE